MKQQKNWKKRNRWKKVLLLALVVLSLIYGAKSVILNLYSTPYHALVQRYSREYGLDAHFVYAMIKAESNFSSSAVSDKNATGLMQIMIPTGEWIAEQLGEPFSKDMLFEPATNIRMGCFYISYLLDMYDGNKTCALAAYNAGYANVNNWLSQEKYSKDGKTLMLIPYPETAKYVNRVKNNEKLYDRLYGVDEG